MLSEQDEKLNKLQPTTKVALVHPRIALARPFQVGAVFKTCSTDMNWLNGYPTFAIVLIFERSKRSTLDLGDRSHVARHGSAR